MYATIGLLIYYWVDKYILLTKRSVKHTISAAMPFEMLEILDINILIFTISSFYFRYTLCGEYSSIGIFMVVFSIIYTIAPTEQLSLYLFPVRESQNETLTYEEAKADLDTDYDRENPILRGHALNEFITLRRKKLQNIIRQS